MPKNFPLSYYDSSAANDYGGTDVSKNLHYPIHNVNNQSLFTSDGAFDVYTFSEQPGESDSPQRSYSLIIIKNTGAHNSHLNVSEITLETDDPNAGFSLVTSFDQINNAGATGDFGNTILTPALYDTILSGISGAEALTNPTPLGYIKLNNNSGNVSEAYFGGSSRYIPFYNPNDIISNTSDNDGISANNLGGSTTYPEYAAFLLKCDPTGSVNATASENNILTINCVGFNEVVFQLAVVGYREGALAYEQGFISGSTYTALNDKTFLNHQVSVAITGENPYSTANANNLTGTPRFDETLPAENNFYFQYVPDDYHKECLAFSVDNVASQSTQYLRLFDTTTNTGGVRLYHNDQTAHPTFTPYANPNPGPGGIAEKYLPLNTTNQVAVTFIDNSISDDQSSDTDVTLVFTTSETSFLAENQNFYQAIYNNNSNLASQHFLNLTDVGQDFTKFLHPDTSQVVGSTNNWRPHLTRHLILYNKFYVDGNQGEATQKDNIHVLSGAYRVFSTDSVTLQKYTNHDKTVSNLSGKIENVDSNIEQTSRVGSATSSSGHVRSLIHGYGINSNVESTPKDCEFTLTPQGTGTNSTSGGELSIYKHHHIYDYFHFPEIYPGTNLEFSDITLRFNNLAGTDNCYIENFRFINPTIDGYFGPDGDQESYVSVSHLNSEFAPLKITTTGGTEIANPSRVFSAGYTSNLSYSSYNDGGNNQYLANSTYKTVKLVYNFSPNRKQNSSMPIFNKNSAPETTLTGIDKIGRRTHAGISVFNTNSLDFIQGATQQSNSNKVITASNMPSTNVLNKGINFIYDAVSLIEHIAPIEYVGETSASLSDWDTSVANTFITEYAGVNKFGTHDASSSNREEITDAIVESHSQPVTFTTANAEHGMTNHLYGLQHKYASITRSHDYYYRKYPLNGRMVFKYEKYLNNLGLHQAANSTGESYGILPGPLAVGNFTDNGNPIKGYESNKTILSSQSFLNSADTSKYEAFISVNIKNKSNKLMHLVSIELDNEVGDAKTGVYGDPRFVFGSGQQTVNSSGVVSAGEGEYYETPVSDQASNTKKVAPSNSIVKVCSATGGGSTTISVSPDTSGLKVGQILFAENNTFLPTANTKIASINSSSNQVTLTNATANESSKDVVFDYENPKYVIWDIVRGQRKNSTGALTKFSSLSPLDMTILPSLETNGNIGLEGAGPYGSNAATNFHNTYELGANEAESAAVWVGAYVIPDGDNLGGILPGTKVASITDNNTWVLDPAPTVQRAAGTTILRFVQVDRTQINEDFFNNPATIKQDIGKDTLKLDYDNKGDLVRTNTGDDDDVIPNATFYDNYDSYTDLDTGAPHIYFAANVASVGTNDIDEAEFYNRVRIKYIVFDKLDAYGVNQERITNNSISGNNFTSERANEAHVYEDVYLVKVNFSNTIPELEVSDLEGDTSNSNQVIDFGVLSTG